MRTVLLLLFATCTAFCAWTHPTSIDKDGMLKVNGERVFILGLYQQAEDDAGAAEVADAGFNLIRCGSSKEDLDRAQAHGLEAWIPLGGVAVSSDKDAEQLKSIVDSWKNHPALAVWEGPDEILWNVWYSRWMNAEKRWNEVEQVFKKYKETHSSPGNPDALHAQWLRYRRTGRFALAEGVEEDLRKTLEMPPANERLSEWCNYVDPLYEQLERGTDVIRKADPQHVLWFNHAPRNSMEDLTRFGTVADIVGCDIYPVPPDSSNGHSDLIDKTITSVGAYTRRMAKSAPGKPVWMVLQGFGWKDIGGGGSTARPTYSQTRFMAYDAIVYGARGILYWGTHAIERDSELWSDIKKVVSELDSLQPFLSAPDRNDGYSLAEYPSSRSDERPVVFMAKERDGRWAFIVVNEADEATQFDLCGLEKLNGKELEVLNEGESLVVKNGRVTYGLPGRGASVLVTKK